MELYGRATSFNVQKVQWMLAELGLNFSHIEKGGRFGGLDEPEFAALNPMKKVPVLVDGEKVIWESHSIIRYLIAEYGDQEWYPSSAYSRSLYERWMDWSQVIFQPHFMAVFWGYYRMPPSNRDWPAIDAALARCNECLTQLEQQLARQPFLAGEMMTAADITVGAILYRLTEQGLSVPLPPNVRKWYNGIQQRDGYQRYIMSDFSELKHREDY
ncbi:glutathione S-transferase family protein [Thaumasiovibrio subtropicus]|uniref:glutathione S-transferase family protein n=1 Tax=Thaumasiovibrio subtropicus TaxID=1891207 RepID=UPI000B35B40C|nr:glutathione S-transferase family protein [Thaumasiovibrio subtropicus]